MKAVPEHLSINLRGAKRWGVAAAAGACTCFAWFAYLNRDGCWFYLRGTRGLTVFVLPWLWLLLMFGFRMKGRIVLVFLTLLGVLFWPHIDTVSFAAAESSAVATLRQLRSTVESHEVEQQHPRYPRTLPEMEPAYPLWNAYRFEYVPSVSANGTIDAYIIKATPLRRSCGCIRSFTIAEDGRLYVTLEERAATVSDQLLQ
jgi:hypothetical protein